MTWFACLSATATDNEDAASQSLQRTPDSSKSGQSKQRSFLRAISTSKGVFSLRAVSRYRDCGTQTNLAGVTWVNRTYDSDAELPKGRYKGGMSAWTNQSFDVDRDEMTQDYSPMIEEHHGSDVASLLMVNSEDTATEAGDTLIQQVKKVFMDYNSVGSRSDINQMDRYRFTKLCRDCNLLSRRHDTASMNIIFIKCKGSKGSKLSFKQFLSALRTIADLQNLDLATVHSRVARSLDNASPKTELNNKISKKQKMGNRSPASQSCQYPPVTPKTLGATSSSSPGMSGCSLSAFEDPLQLGRQNVIPITNPTEIRTPKSTVTSVAPKSPLATQWTPVGAAVAHLNAADASSLRRSLANNVLEVRSGRPSLKKLPSWR